MRLPAGGVAAIIDWPTAILTAATAVALQISGNLVNDYGDTQNGAGSAGRQGPPRMEASGRIHRRAMKKGLCLSAGLYCLLAISLPVTALPALAQSSGADWPAWLLLGATALAEAYGYIGSGDMAAFLFFGRPFGVANICTQAV
ncbi:hypothetical protein [Neisseria yangbaofengii]|uniref:hypothetical protein n=1 Tax=Neisseria yangbaofengii TaxID=2709396 RepID=UPI001D031B9A|nr:hypothetical protein [Neisseria yangbaofengii]